jgi:hypothetical protein
VPDSVVTSNTAVSLGSGIPVPSADSQMTFATKPEWLPPADPESAPEIKMGNLTAMRRMSSPAPLGGLRIIHEGEISQGHILSFEKMLAVGPGLRPRARPSDLSLDKIGVIPEP